MGDLLFDVCFFLLAIAGTSFVIVMRKRFDLLLSLPICIAWALKGARHLYSDWMVVAVRNMETEDIFLFVRKAHLALGGMDLLVALFLCAALVRLGILCLYSHWYRKARKELNMESLHQ
ncbi:MAG: hypothetical protein IKD27_07855 [Oscillospiraceae bacterium]|nr:hypothetical protein [Oscillospiraceae bacterium]